MPVYCDCQLSYCDKTLDTTYLFGTVLYTVRYVTYVLFAVGYLDPGADTPHIQPGTRLEVPFWLARAIAGGGRRKRTTASIELPRQYREGYREILLADAGVVDLHRLGPYYYAFGSRLIRHFEHTESADIARSLLKVMFA